jgi:hypothetical protein
LPPGRLGLTCLEGLRIVGKVVGRARWPLKYSSNINDIWPR